MRGRIGAAGALEVAFFASLLLAVLLAAPASAYWDDRASGWFWYEQRPAPVPTPEPPPAAPVPPPEVAAHRALQAKLEQQRIIAIMAPTAANISAYLHTQKEVLDRSAMFADMWQRVVWSTPELDYSLRGRPTDAAALYAHDSDQRLRQAGLLARAASGHGLFFVFGRDCLHCAQMAAALQRLQDEHKMPVQAVALAGASSEAFPDAWPDNGFAAAAGIASVPAIMLASLDGSARLLPIAYGPLSYEQLQQRIAVAAGIPVGERF